MRELLSRVLELQPAYSSGNTPEMQERGQLIRHGIPAAINAAVSSLGFRREFDDIACQGRDGTGLKNEVPWVRLYSRARSPSATQGWYCVYLFHADGNAVSLCLVHGSTQFINGEYKPRSSDETERLVSWANSALKERGASTDDLQVDALHLGGSSPTTRAYERTIVVYRTYTRSAVPADRELLRDLQRFSDLLQILYELGDLGRSPETQNTDVSEIVALSSALSRGSTKGMRFGLTAKERSAVEKRAMKVAADWLRANGYTYTDVSHNCSFDYEAQKGNDTFIVEVKGSTGPLTSILLTKNEVAIHTERHPMNILLLIDNIDLDRSRSTPKASGGCLRVIAPWVIEHSHLSPLSYSYDP